jgi:hypothetical protein
MTVRSHPLPEGALLGTHARDGHYTDCFAADTPAAVSQAQYVEAFYTTWVFKLERWILRWAIARPSTDEQAGQLAAGTLKAFSAWAVEARASDQLVMRDQFSRRTCSWLMVAPLPGGGTRLYFGSGVSPQRGGGLGLSFGLMLGLHKLYSRILLGAARRRLEDLGDG